jgi:hypothetical protein
LVGSLQLSLPPVRVTDLLEGDIDAGGAFHAVETDDSGTYNASCTLSISAPGVLQLRKVVKHEDYLQFGDPNMKPGDLTDRRHTSVSIRHSRHGDRNNFTVTNIVRRATVRSKAQEQAAAFGEGEPSKDGRTSIQADGDMVVHGQSSLRLLSEDRHPYAGTHSVRSATHVCTGCREVHRQRRGVVALLRAPQPLSQTWTRAALAARSAGRSTAHGEASTSASPDAAESALRSISHAGPTDRPKLFSQLLQDVEESAALLNQVRLYLE